jgi:hypothetical protein
MILSYCQRCEQHVIVQVEDFKYSKCQKEKCLSVYTKCVADEAVKQFLQRDGHNAARKAESALEICYEKV